MVEKDSRIMRDIRAALGDNIVDDLLTKDKAPMPTHVNKNGKVCRGTRKIPVINKDDGEDLNIRRCAHFDECGVKVRWKGRSNSVGGSWVISKK
jgi:hypothetical protein